MERRLRFALAFVAVVAVAYAHYYGLFWVPPERSMGETGRIMYAHVPSVWAGMLALTINFFCSVAYLFKASWKTDALAEASAEVGLVFGAVGVLLGSIWGRPTWGVWWDWDPRLTTAAILLVAYAGYMALRRFVDDPDRRATWSAVVAIIASVDIPITYFSVVWWKSLHQVQSNRASVDKPIAALLGFSSLAFVFLMATFLWNRYRIAAHQLKQEFTLPELPAAPAKAGDSVGAPS